MTEVLISPDGGLVLPGNRWDLLGEIELVEMPTVTVVVPYFNDQSGLDQVLTALSVQNYPADRVDVVVADDGSTRPPSLEAAGQLSIRVVTQRDLGFRAAAARNLGAADATGEIVAFLDSDTVPERDYLRRLVRLPALAPDAFVTGRRRHADFSSWSAAAVRGWLTGDTGGPPELTEPAWLRNEHASSADLLHLHRDSYRFVISAVLACRRSLFEEVGGFDASLVGYGGEDWDFAHRVLCAGAVLAHVPAAVAWHSGSDWAERGTPESRREEKAAETAALAARIPSLPSSGVVSPVGGAVPPDVIVEIAGTDSAALQRCVESVLVAPRITLIKLSGSAAHRVKAEHYGADDRVTADPVAHRLLDRARICLSLPQPCALSETFWKTITDELENGRAGEMVVTAPDGDVVVTATATRATRRARRWQGVFEDRDLVGELFGRVSLTPDAFGMAQVGLTSPVAEPRGM